MTTSARRRWPAILLAVAGLAAVGYGWWFLWGDSIPAQRAMDNALHEWRSAAPPTTQAPTAWRTDLDNTPLLDAEDLHGTFGVLHVPAWAGLVRTDMPIKAGVSDPILATGAAGWYPDTAGPGEVGNFGLAAHRRTRGNSFLHTIDLVPGVDVVVVETAAAWLRYEITDNRIVPAHYLDALLPVPGAPDDDPSARKITLTTCATADGGQWGNTHRVITHGVLTGWLPREARPPEVPG
jgi:sortase A